MATDALKRFRPPLGCLILIGIVAILHLGNAARLLIPNWINHAKWENHHIAHYRSEVYITGFVSNYGSNVIEVENGKVISGRHLGEDGESDDGAECALESGCDPSDYDRLTIEHMFEISSGCFWLFPLLVCEYRYNPEYGYPEGDNSPCMAIRIPASECGIYRDIIEFQPLE